MTLKHPGVCWDKQHQRWKARIFVDGERHTVGLFTSEIEAAQERRAYAHRHFPPATAERALQGNRKLDPEDALLIRERWAQGRSVSQLARQFGVTHAHISRIVSGQRWRRVQG